MRCIVKKINGKSHRGGYKRTQKVSVLKSLEHLQNVWLNLFELKTRSTRYVVLDRRAEEPIQDRAIRVRETGQLDWEGRLQLYSITFRPGHLFSRYLFGPGKQVALLATLALAYNPRSQKYEKRLARCLSWQSRVRASQLDYLQPYRVSTLLQAIDLQSNRRFPNRVLTRLERALDTLKNDGLISAWQYAGDRAEQSRIRWLGRCNVSIECRRLSAKRPISRKRHETGLLNHEFKVAVPLSTCRGVTCDPALAGRLSNERARPWSRRSPPTLRCGT